VRLVNERPDDRADEERRTPSSLIDIVYLIGCFVATCALRVSGQSGPAETVKHAVSYGPPPVFEKPFLRLAGDPLGRTQKKGDGHPGHRGLGGVGGHLLLGRSNTP